MEECVGGVVTIAFRPELHECNTFFSQISQKGRRGINPWLHVGRSDFSFLRYIKAEHSYRNTRLHDERGRLGVTEHVELYGIPTDPWSLPCATHHGEVSYFFLDFRAEH